MEPRFSGEWVTFADGHGRDGALDCILSFVAVFAIEIDAEFVVFSFAGSTYAHGEGRGDR